MADRLSAGSGVDRRDLELASGEIEALLDLAGVAARNSGARTNAPLTCYLVGLARGRTGASLDALLASASTTSPGESAGDAGQAEERS